MPLNDDPGARMHEHEHDATLALDHQIIYSDQMRPSRSRKSRAPHGPTIALPNQHKRDAGVDINASTSGSIIRAPHAHSVRDAAATNGSMGHPFTASRPPGAFQHYGAADGRTRRVSGAVRAPNREPRPR